ncbi:uncharacterized protein PIP4K isoform X3 [Eurosta solidaginis]|uniref:uncharacterized protein PIP4K isoform X3 n=1 Tax=Eurosta solidaginis TaxID=178769 RepID=UPI003530A6B5
MKKVTHEICALRYATFFVTDVVLKMYTNPNAKLAYPGQKTPPRRRSTTSEHHQPKKLELDGEKIPINSDSYLRFDQTLGVENFHNYKILKRDIDSKYVDKLIYPLKPLHERIRNYIEARNRIFQDRSEPNKSSIKTKRSTLRLRRFWKAIKDRKKVLISSILNEEDARYYAKVKLLDREMFGLLNTGANISCIGSSLAKEDLLNLSEFRKFKSNVKTADRKSQTITGYLDINIEYKAKIKRIKLYIIPSISQNLILGNDFWKLFELAPSIISSISSNDKCQSSSDRDNPHISENYKSLLYPLTEGQRQQLEAVKLLFPDFEKQGLGRTSLLRHEIDVGEAKAIKQRFYPVSPAVEKLMYQDVNRMLKLGVTEKSQSPWTQ